MPKRTEGLYSGIRKNIGSREQVPFEPSLSALSKFSKNTVKDFLDIGMLPIDVGTTMAGKIAPLPSSSFKPEEMDRLVAKRAEEMAGTSRKIEDIQDQFSRLPETIPQTLKNIYENPKEVGQSAWDLLTQHPVAVAPVATSGLKLGATGLIRGGAELASSGAKAATALDSSTVLPQLAKPLGKALKVATATPRDNIVKGLNQLTETFVSPRYRLNQMKYNPESGKWAYDPLMTSTPRDVYNTPLFMEDATRELLTQGKLAEISDKTKALIKNIKQTGVSPEDVGSYRVAKQLKTGVNKGEPLGYSKADIKEWLSKFDKKQIAPGNKLFDQWLKETREPLLFRTLGGEKAYDVLRANKSYSKIVREPYATNSRQAKSFLQRGTTNLKVANEGKSSLWDTFEDTMDMSRRVSNKDALRNLLQQIEGVDAGPVFRKVRQPAKPNLKTQELSTPEDIEAIATAAQKAKALPEGYARLSPSLQNMAGPELQNLALPEPVANALRKIYTKDPGKFVTTLQESAPAQAVKDFIQTRPGVQNAADMLSNIIDKADITKAITRSNSLLKAGAVGKNIRFLAKNPFSDFLEAMKNEKYVKGFGMKNVPDIQYGPAEVPSALAANNLGKYAKRAFAEGFAPISENLAADPVHQAARYSGAFGNKFLGTGVDLVRPDFTNKKLGKLSQNLKNKMTPLEEFSIGFESANRTPQFERFLNKNKELKSILNTEGPTALRDKYLAGKLTPTAKEDFEKAVTSAAEITVNFNKKTPFNAMVERFSPFYNVKMQGLFNDLYSMYHYPKTSVVRGDLAASAPWATADLSRLLLSGKDYESQDDESKKAFLPIKDLGFGSEKTNIFGNTTRGNRYFGGLPWGRYGQSGIVRDTLYDLNRYLAPEILRAIDPNSIKAGQLEEIRDNYKKTISGLTKPQFFSGKGTEAERKEFIGKGMAKAIGFGGLPAQIYQSLIAETPRRGLSGEKLIPDYLSKYPKEHQVYPSTGNVERLLGQATDTSPLRWSEPVRTFNYFNALDALGGLIGVADKATQLVKERAGETGETNYKAFEKAINKEASRLKSSYSDVASKTAIDDMIREKKREYLFQHPQGVKGFLKNPKNKEMSGLDLFHKVLPFSASAQGYPASAMVTEMDTRNPAAAKDNLLFESFRKDKGVQQVLKQLNDKQAEEKLIEMILQANDKRGKKDMRTITNPYLRIGRLQEFR